MGLAPNRWEDLVSTSAAWRGEIDLPAMARPLIDRKRFKEGVLNCIILVVFGADERHPLSPFRLRRSEVNVTCRMELRKDSRLLRGGGRREPDYCD